jgi:hypothetical protein
MSSIWEEVLGWVFRRPPLASVPYEELVRRYPKERKEAFDEFVRRLSGIVFLAAADFCKREGVERAAELTTSAFEAFLPHIVAGVPEMVLRRFAGTIRGVLDDEAFRTIERLYYLHLPLYHLQDDEQRRCLEAMLASGLAAEAPQIAERLLLPVERVEQLLKAGNRELDRVMHEDFEEAELRELTEGVLPLPWKELNHD